MELIARLCNPSCASYFVFMLVCLQSWSYDWLLAVYSLYVSRHFASAWSGWCQFRSLVTFTFKLSAIGFHSYRLFVASKELKNRHDFLWKIDIKLQENHEMSTFDLFFGFLNGHKEWFLRFLGFFLDLFKMVTWKVVYM